MPVIDYPVHPKTIGGELYGCHNHPPFHAHVTGSSAYGSQEWRHVMSTDCRYDKSLGDQKCRGCDHRGSGEDYDRRMRSAV